MWRQARIAVVIPAFEEESLVAVTLQGIPAFVDLVFVVDDASSDRTATTARAMADPRVQVLQHARNQGVGAAIRTGYDAAQRARAEVIVVMAADNQMDPNDLPTVLEPVVAGRADYVKGNRFLHPRVADMPIARRLAGRVLATWTCWATGLQINDSQCGYTAIAGSALKRIALDDLWPRYGYPNDLLCLVAAEGLKVAEVPVRPVYAGERSGVRAWHMFTIGRLLLRRVFLGRKTTNG